ncbi:MAG: Transcriptional repressor NrdR [Verrucomicrobia subdivision 3 bacterium]|nr:Transcriptional repressor NrdR [Limisphaerales bacterium]MCS1417155.1 Transcriptional repressor NrdR [Limisphaerales bacterium]
MTIRRAGSVWSVCTRLTTYEKIEHEGLMVVKRDKTREQFNKEKFLSEVRKVCQKDPLTPKGSKKR